MQSNRNYKSHQPYSTLRGNSSESRARRKKSVIYATHECSPIGRLAYGSALLKLPYARSLKRVACSSRILFHRHAHSYKFESAISSRGLRLSFFRPLLCLFFLTFHSKLSRLQTILSDQEIEENKRKRYKRSLCRHVVTCIRVAIVFTSLYSKIVDLLIFRFFVSSCPLLILKMFFSKMKFFKY